LSSLEAPSPLALAFREEATGDQVKAVALYMQALDAAAQAPDDPSSLAVIMASLDALVHRQVSALSNFAASSALVDRTSPAALVALTNGGGSVDARLAKAQVTAKGPFAAPLIARARLALAERRGDIDAAKSLRTQTGCVRQATVLGPVAWAPVSGVDQGSSLDRADSQLPQQGPRIGPFSHPSAPLVVRANGCQIPLGADSSQRGVREIVVDVDVPKAGNLGVGLESPLATTLRVGGKVAIVRPHSAGSEAAMRFAHVAVDRPGTLRLVARVGVTDASATIAIGAWDENGKPLHAHAPLPGSRASVAAKRATTLDMRTPRSPGPNLLPNSSDEVLAASLGLLAAHEGRAAEALLYQEIARGARNASSQAPPEIMLAYGRAARTINDLPTVQSDERARSAFDRVLVQWPSAWEAAIEHAVLAGRARAEVGFAVLSDLDRTLAKHTTSAPAVVAAFAAVTASGESLYDRALTALHRANEGIPATLLLHDAERRVFDRTGRELAAFECNPTLPGDRTSLACYHARLAIGDRQGAFTELERLGSLTQSSQPYLRLSSYNALQAGDIARASRDFAAMNPGDQLLSTMYGVKGHAAIAEILERASSTSDAPNVLFGILRASGDKSDDPFAAYSGITEKVVANSANGNSGAALESGQAATTVLAHEEKYDVDERGLVHFVMLDVRRVMGTTDVENNAKASSPTLYGESTIRLQRQRIFKKDGRVLSHANLSQLEAGDAVEAIYEGFALPKGAGNLGIDTPDLLPERTNVQSAHIELRLPKGLSGSLWSHPMLGKAEEHSEGNRRVLTWAITNHPIRRIEYGVPKMDRNVGLSFSTMRWDDVALGLKNTIASLDASRASSPEVSAWAREAAGPTSRETVEAVVAKSAQAVKVASRSVLTDIDLASTAGDTTTARTVLVTHEGSRTLLITSALRDLGIPTDVVLAEDEPFSNTASYPPHSERFTHPLAIAHVPNPRKPGVVDDVWIDADIAGPPLPAGRISPELRGRSALYANGRIEPLPAIANHTAHDEIDQRIVLDRAGNAKGVLTVSLRGRDAQDIGEAFTRLALAERENMLRAVALGWVPLGTIDRVELLSQGSGQVDIRAEFSIFGYAQVEGQKPESRTWVLPGIDPIHTVSPRPYATTLASSYASQVARQSALAIGQATLYHVKRYIELPAATQIVRVPLPFDGIRGKGPLLSASRTIQVSGTTIEDNFTLDVKTGTVPPEHYGEFVAAARNIDDAFRASTRVKLPVR